jgi:hypothetical protein
MQTRGAGDEGQRRGRGREERKDEKEREAKEKRGSEKVT